MKHGFAERTLNRVIANARVIRRAPEAVVLIGIMTAAASYSVSQQFHRERLSALNARIEEQEALFSEDRAKLKGTAAEAATQVRQLTNQLDDKQRRLDETKSRLASFENRTRNPQRLYQGSSAIATVQDPKWDSERKTITFPSVTSQALLEANKPYNFQDWKLICGGTQFYNLVNNGSGSEFSYSPLTCKIVGSR